MELSKLSFDPGIDLKLPSLPAHYVECTFCDETARSQLVDPYSLDAPLPFGNSNLVKSEIVSGRTLTVGDDVKETLELNLNVKHSHEFLPGDSVGIFPKNPAEEVNDILTRLKLEDKFDTPIKITVKEGSTKKLPLYVPAVTTPSVLLSSVLEIRGIVKKAFIRALTEHTTEPTEKRRLLELCSTEGRLDYEDFFLKRRLALADILSNFPSCVPQLSTLVENLPRLMPRAYSIASSPLASATEIKIIFNVISTQSGKRGVCSSWLKKKYEDATDLSKRFGMLGVSSDSATNDFSVPLYFRKPSKFRVPADVNTPLVLIGPGTGVAPFIGFLDHIARTANSESTGKVKRFVYYGCRHRDKDHIGKEQMNQFQDDSILSQYRVCYSRDSLSEADPKYVQDLLYKDKEIVFDMIENPETRIFICGDAVNMTKDVETVLRKIISERSGVSEDAAIDKLKELETNDKILRDVWS